MKAAWSGMIRLALVTLPIRLYAATEERPVRLHEIHVSDGSSLGRRLWREANSSGFMQLSAGFTDVSRHNRCGGIAGSGEPPTALEPPGLLSNQLQQEAVVEGVAGVGSPEPSRGELEQRFHLGPRAQAAGV
jgi:hypothetical protein